MMLNVFPINFTHGLLGCSHYVPHVVPSRNPHIMMVYIFYSKVYSQVNSCDQVWIFLSLSFQEGEGLKIPLSLSLSLSLSHTHTTRGMNCMGLGGVSQIGKSSLLLLSMAPYFSVLSTWDGRYKRAPLPHWELRDRFISGHEKLHTHFRKQRKLLHLFGLAWPGGLLALKTLHILL